jgi:hypothetical protein
MTYPWRVPTFEQFLVALRKHHHVEVRMEPMNTRVRGSIAREYMVITRVTKDGNFSAVAYPPENKRTVSWDEMRSVCRQLKVDVRELDIGLELGFPGGD